MTAQASHVRAVQRQAAPTPDYRSDLPRDPLAGVEICSCDEALALRRELARVNGEIAERDGRTGVATGPDGGLAFCPQCGVGVGVDEHGCCSTCGADVCSMSQLAGHLGAVGLRVEGAFIPDYRAWREPEGAEG